MTTLVFDAADEHDTERLGAALAAALPQAATIALCGTLGAGKTRLVQAIAAACGVPREEVVSPTFVLCQQYDGTRTINHLDAYRLSGEGEFRELGVEELFAADAITIIEWADRVELALPDEYLRIDIEVTGPTARRFIVASMRGEFGAVLEALQFHLSTEY